jgi:5-(carboxyamino)imidazole ribonucleotide synthase
MKLGILGGGQLARMLALAGHPLGVSCVVLDPAKDVCANVVADQVVGGYSDVDALDAFATQVDVATYEFENLPAESVARVSNRVPVYPSAMALAVARDRLKEKTLFRELGIGTPDFAAVDSLADLEAAVVRIGLPSVLKTRTLGYDGKGQFVLRADTDLADVWRQTNGVPCILESFVSFQREISALAVRTRDGSVAFYPVTENTHAGGILRLSIPRDGDPMQQQAEVYARLLLEKLDYVGVLALELFDTPGGLLANEMAPRVHNSGHWTIDGAETSQFENHIRAVLGLPLGVCALRHPAVAMVNFIGDMPSPSDVLSIQGAHLHAYGKAGRTGRKVGHATICGPDHATIARGLARLQSLAAACDR